LLFAWQVSLDLPMPEVSSQVPSVDEAHQLNPEIKLVK
jgi:hypothetical protein